MRRSFGESHGIGELLDPDRLPLGDPKRATSEGSAVEVPPPRRATGTRTAGTLVVRVTARAADAPVERPAACSLPNERDLQYSYTIGNS